MAQNMWEGERDLGAGGVVRHKGMQSDHTEINFSSRCLGYSKAKFCEVFPNELKLSVTRANEQVFERIEA